MPSQATVTLLARRLSHPFRQSAARALGGAMLPASCSKQQAAARAACSSTTVRFPTVITVRVLCRGSDRERFGSTVQVPRFSDRFSGHPVFPNIAMSALPGLQVS